MSPGQTELMRGTWKLVAVRLLTSPVAFIPDNADYGITFEPGGAWKGVNACNTCEGRYTLTTDTGMTLSDVSCSETVCPEPLTWDGYGEALTQVTRFALEENRLTLFYTDAMDDEWEMIHTRIE